MSSVSDKCVVPYLLNNVSKVSGFRMAVFMQSNRQRKRLGAQLGVPCSEEKIHILFLCRQIFSTTSCFQFRLLDVIHGCGVHSMPPYQRLLSYQSWKNSIATSMLSRVIVTEVNIFKVSPFTADCRHCNLQPFLAYCLPIQLQLVKWDPAQVVVWTIGQIGSVMFCIFLKYNASHCKWDFLCFLSRCFYCIE